MMDTRKKENIYPGQEVDVIVSFDNKSSKITRGFVEAILSEDEEEGQGVKVKLKSGVVGNVREIITEHEDKAV